jgi:hypothetical protein
MAGLNIISEFTGWFGLRSTVPYLAGANFTIYAITSFVIIPSI